MLKNIIVNFVECCKYMLNVEIFVICSLLKNIIISFVICWTLNVDKF